MKYAIIIIPVIIVVQGETSKRLLNAMHLMRDMANTGRPSSPTDRLSQYSTTSLPPEGNSVDSRDFCLLPSSPRLPAQSPGHVTGTVATGRDRKERAASLTSTTLPSGVKNSRDVISLTGSFTHGRNKPETLSKSHSSSAYPNRKSRGKKSIHSPIPTPPTSTSQSGAAVKKSTSSTLSPYSPTTRVSPRASPMGSPSAGSTTKSISSKGSPKASPSPADSSHFSSKVEKNLSSLGEHQSSFLKPKNTAPHKGSSSAKTLASTSQGK